MNHRCVMLSAENRLIDTLSRTGTVRGGPGDMRLAFVDPPPPARLPYRVIGTISAAAGVEKASGTLRTNARPTIRTIVLRSSDKGDPIPVFGSRWTVPSIKSIGTFLRIGHRKRALSGICGSRSGRLEGGFGRFVRPKGHVGAKKSAVRGI